MKLRKNLLILLLGGLLVSCNSPASSLDSSSSDSSLSSSVESSISSSVESSSNEPVTFNNVKAYLNYFNTNKNYSLLFTRGSSYKYDLRFNEKALGIVSSNRDLLDCYVQDNEGVYKLNYNEDYISSEYLVDTKGQLSSSIWDNSSAQSIYGVGTSYIASLASDLSELVVTNKAYKLQFMKMLGFSNSDYVNVNEMKMSIKDNALIVDINIEGQESIHLQSANLGTTVMKDVDNFIKNGGTKYTPNEDLSNFRRLFRANNFTRKIVDVGDTEIKGYELFNPHYFYSETAGTNYGSGHIALKSAANNLNGCYSFTLVGSLKSGFTNPSLLNTPSYEKPDVVEMYHYPTKMNLFDNMQYLSEGYLPIGGYTPSGNTYHTENSDLLSDFAYNFSLEKYYPLNEYKPYSLMADIFLFQDDQDTEITFYYYFTYQGSAYVMTIPFINFGSSNIDILDTIYTQYND